MSEFRDTLYNDLSVFSLCYIVSPLRSVPPLSRMGERYQVVVQVGIELFPFLLQVINIVKGVSRKYCRGVPAISGGGGGGGEVMEYTPTQKVVEVVANFE